MGNRQKLGVGTQFARPHAADLSKPLSDRILLAARRVFSERGYGGATFEAVAARAGVTRPAIHYHHKSKADLFAAVLASDTALVRRVLVATWEHQTVSASLQALRRSTRRDFAAACRFLLFATIDCSRFGLPCDSSVADTLTMLLQWLDPTRESGDGDEAFVATGLVILSAAAFVARGDDCISGERGNLAARLIRCLDETDDPTSARCH